MSARATICHPLTQPRAGCWLGANAPSFAVKMSGPLECQIRPRNSRPWQAEKVLFTPCTMAASLLERQHETAKPAAPKDVIVDVTFFSPAPSSSGAFLIEGMLGRQVLPKSEINRLGCARRQPQHTRQILKLTGRPEGIQRKPLLLKT